MKKMICSSEARLERAVDDWSVREVAARLGVSLTYFQYITFSDQEVEVWEEHPHPWALDAAAFVRAFDEHFGGKPKWEN